MHGFETATIHNVPGRLRVRVPQHACNYELALTIANAMKAVDGLISIKTNHLTGSVTVRYRPELTSAAQIFERFKRANLVGGNIFLLPATGGTRRATPSTATRAVLAFTLTLVLEKTIEHLLHKALR